MTFSASEAEPLVRFCLARGLKLTAAESCTGGLISTMITSVPGASGCFGGSLVTYSAETKNRFAGVPAELISRFGVVSAECARAMAEGAASALGADVAIAVTGWAGPLPGDDGRPAGTVFVAVSYRDRTVCEEHRFPGGRNAVRKAAAEAALKAAYEAVSAEARA